MISKLYKINNIPPPSMHDADGHSLWVKTRGFVIMKYSLTHTFRFLAILFMFLNPSVLNAENQPENEASADSERGGRHHDDCNHDECDHHEDCDNCCRGEQGPRGERGERGLPGENGRDAAIGYGYVWTQGLTAGVVANNANVSFNNNGPLNGVLHTSPSSDVYIAAAGTYAISWSVNAGEANAFELFLNGSAIPGSRYSQPGFPDQNQGQVIVTIPQSSILIPNGALLQLRNVSGALITFSSFGGLNAQASLLIHRVQ